MIAPTASMTIHPVRMTGVVVGAPQTYQYFNRIQEQIVDFVTANSRISPGEVPKVYDGHRRDRHRRGLGGLWPGGGAQVGLVDQLGSVGDALAYLHQEISKAKAPAEETGAKQQD